jgi:hypothetical protein
MRGLIAGSRPFARDSVFKTGVVGFFPATPVFPRIQPRDSNRVWRNQFFGELRVSDGGMHVFGGSCALCSTHHNPGCGLWEFARNSVPLRPTNADEDLVAGENRPCSPERIGFQSSQSSQSRFPVIDADIPQSTGAKPAQIPTHTLCRVADGVVMVLRPDGGSPADCPVCRSPWTS